MSYRFRTHNLGSLSLKNKGEKVILSGWVHRRRNFGSLMFVDLRDRYGITQLVADESAFGESFKDIKYETVLRVEGEVKERAPENINPDIPTGEIEVVVEKMEVLSSAKALPFEIVETKKGEEDEELRLKYRFLELRRERLKNNLLFRNKMEQYIHKYMQDREFVHVATPILTVSSPEGARDFLVPSRLHPGKFYALPQAPQQYKQLLMVAGIDRYYQIAPCMRDEDPRADRSPGEFYQLDCETSFLTRDEFFALMEPLFVGLTEEVAGKKVKNKPFPRLPYKYVMETYGSDRPDLRFDLPIKDVSAWAKTTPANFLSQAEYVRALAVPEGAKLSRKEIEEELGQAAARQKAKGLAWLKLESGQFSGSIAKILTADNLTALTDLLELKEGVLVLFVADSYEVSAKALGSVRSYLGEKLSLADPNEVAWAWVVDFPFFEWNDEAKKVDFAHNPFSMPQGGLKALNEQDPLTILADQYDIIANGLELSSGAVRNKDAEIMYRAFEVAGYDKEVVDKKFGHMIDAFSYGAPPHCGFAPGIERLVMLLTGEKNIRSVVPFPKNQRAEEPMMGSPSAVDARQLKELSIKIDV